MRLESSATALQRLTVRLACAVYTICLSLKTRQEALKSLITFGV